MYPYPSCCGRMISASPMGTLETTPSISPGSRPWPLAASMHILNSMMSPTVRLWALPRGECDRVSDQIEAWLLAQKSYPFSRNSFHGR